MKVPLLPLAVVDVVSVAVARRRHRAEWYLAVVKYLWEGNVMCTVALG